MGRVRVTIVYFEKQEVLHTHKLVGYPVYTVLAPYCHLWPVWLYCSFPNLVNGTIFEKKVIVHKMRIFIFATFFSEAFLILRRTERNMIKHLYWSSRKVLVVLVRL
jgi:hypothetical protein